MRFLHLGHEYLNLSFLIGDNEIIAIFNRSIKNDKKRKSGQSGVKKIIGRFF